MTRLEKLQNKIHNDGIIVNEYSFNTNQKAACMEYDDYKTIAIDRAAIRGSAEELVVVAEEYAHYATGALYDVCPKSNESHARFIRMMAEGQAHRHAMHTQVPFDEMKEVLTKYMYYDGDIDMDGLAEHFEVTYEFVKQAVDHYYDIGRRW